MFLLSRRETTSVYSELTAENVGLCHTLCGNFLKIYSVGSHLSTNFSKTVYKE